MPTKQVLDFSPKKFIKGQYEVLYCIRWFYEEILIRENSTFLLFDPFIQYYNIMSSVSVKVVARVRPHGGVASSRGGRPFVGINTHEVLVDSGKGEQKFAFDCVFGPDSTQDDVFKSIGAPVVAEVFKGYNGTILAYGQTGSGTVSYTHLTLPTICSV